MDLRVDLDEFVASSSNTSVGTNPRTDAWDSSGVERAGVSRARDLRFDRFGIANYLVLGDLRREFSQGIKTTALALFRHSKATPERSAASNSFKYGKRALNRFESELSLFALDFTEGPPVMGRDRSLLRTPEKGPCWSVR